jgi:pyruvate kinase
VVGCSLPEVLRDLETGERVFYDDASLIGVVKEVHQQGALVEVTFTRKPRLKIKPDKTLNFPDSKLTLPSLTAQDLDALDFIAGRADLVGLSFVRDAGDVLQIQHELERRSADLGIVIKIETTQAFNQLPRILFAAMRSPRVGVMVARGDMAVELGFVRLAEAQEEILWMCEAARVPVIWATQVLENLNKNGVPSRAEVTDAAMSGRAECVMLNRGSHLPQTLTFLRDVLERMQEHQHKKRAMLRRLRISMLD